MTEPIFGGDQSCASPRKQFILNLQARSLCKAMLVNAQMEDIVPRFTDLVSVELMFAIVFRSADLSQCEGYSDNSIRPS